MHAKQIYARMTEKGESVSSLLNPKKMERKQRMFLNCIGVISDIRFCYGMAFFEGMGR